MQLSMVRLFNYVPAGLGGHTGFHRQDPSSCSLEKDLEDSMIAWQIRSKREPDALPLVLSPLLFNQLPINLLERY